MAKTVLPAHQERSRQTLERLVKAAVEILDKDGLEGATMPRIAARAGVSAGAIYRRFPDKDALLREVYLRMLESNFRRSQEFLTEANWKEKTLAQMCRQLVEMTVKGHTLHRGLLRSYASFTLQHPDAAFVRKCEDLESKLFRSVSDLLLTRRHEIGHPDPDAAVPLALLMTGVTTNGILVLPKDPKHFAALVPDVEIRLQSELPDMVLRYLRIEEAKKAARK